MSVEVTLPSLGVAILEATVVKWLKEEGQPVAKEEPIAEVESDKVSFEVVSPMDGVLLKRLCEVSGIVKVNEVVGAAGERYAGRVEGGRAASEAAPEPVRAQKPEPAARVRATPAAKALAKKQGIDLARVRGSGPDGVVTKEDVATYQETPPEVQAVSAAEERIPFSGVRKKTADKLARSRSEMVQVTTAVEVDMTEADLLRKKWKDTLARRLGIRLTFMPFFIRAAVMAVREYPVLNSALEGDEIVIRRNVDFGIAVQSERGLIVPVVKGAQDQAFWELARELDALTGQAREGVTDPRYVGGATITLSNAGAYGSVISTPVISSPQSALIWTGAILEKPAVKEGAIVARKLMNLCVSYDHRIMDGATVARFLGRMKNLLEEPMLLAMDERGM